MAARKYEPDFSEDRELAVRGQCPARRKMKLEPCKFTAWRENRQQDYRRWRSRLEFWTRLCRGWLVSDKALSMSLEVWCSLQMVAGAILTSTDRSSEGVGCRQSLVLHPTLLCEHCGTSLVLHILHS